MEQEQGGRHPGKSRPLSFTVATVSLLTTPSNVLVSALNLIVSDWMELRVLNTTQDRDTATWLTQAPALQPLFLLTAKQFCWVTAYTRRRQGRARKHTLNSICQSPLSFTHPPLMPNFSQRPILWSACERQESNKSGGGLRSQRQIEVEDYHLLLPQQVEASSVDPALSALEAWPTERQTLTSDHYSVVKSIGLLS